jgi:hypothetical protein
MRKTIALFTVLAGLGIGFGLEPAAHAQDDSINPDTSCSDVFNGQYSTHDIAQRISELIVEADTQLSPEPILNNMPPYLQVLFTMSIVQYCKTNPDATLVFTVVHFYNRVKNEGANALLTDNMNN